MSLMRLFFSEVDEVVQCLQSKAPEEMLLWALVRLIVIVHRAFSALFLKYLWSIWRSEDGRSRWWIVI